MGRITNKAKQQDPISDIAVFGFAKKNDALTYAMTLPSKPEVPPKIQRDLHREQFVDYDETLWFVFWHTDPNANRVLLMVSECYSDLNLTASSYGAQMVLK